MNAVVMNCSNLYCFSKILPIMQSIHWLKNEAKFGPYRLLMLTLLTWILNCLRLYNKKKGRCENMNFVFEWWKKRAQRILNSYRYHNVIIFLISKRVCKHGLLQLTSIRFQSMFSLRLVIIKIKVGFPPSAMIGDIALTTIALSRSPTLATRCVFIYHDHQW